MKKGNSKRKNDVIFILFSLVLGLFMGWISKDIAGLETIGAVIENMGIWLFVSTLLAVYTPEAVRGALHAFTYFAGVIFGYFEHILLLSGSAEIQLLLRYLILAVIGGVIGFISGNCRSREWLGAACTAVPVSLLIAEAYPIYKGFSLVLGIDIIFAAVLYILMAPGKMQKLMAMPFIIVFVFALVYFNVFSRIFGGFI